LQSEDARHNLLNKAQSYAHYWQSAFNLNVLIIDYLRLMSENDPRQHRGYQIDEAIRGLKKLATESNLAVIVLAQINRKFETRANLSPNLVDLHDSSSIEEAADTVMFLHRYAYGKNYADPNLDHHADLHIIKNSRGRVGRVDLYYEGSQVRFENWLGPRVDEEYLDRIRKPHGFPG
jgi:replicative DNA helicase